METLTRLVSESLARHGFDRPLDYRRLQWSRWFRCESHNSLLCVPSKPGVFALAEEIMDMGSPKGSGAVPEAGSLKPEADSGRRMLAVAQFFEDDDMAFVLDRMLSRTKAISSSSKNCATASMRRPESASGFRLPASGTAPLPFGLPISMISSAKAKTPGLLGTHRRL